MTIERLVFMGTSAFAAPALAVLTKRYSVVGVYTQPDRPAGRGMGVTQSPVKKVALELGLSVFQPEKLSTPGELEKLRSLNPSVIVVASYGQILKSEVLKLPKRGCINIHSSLLPRWRGAAPIHWAILAGDAETGVTTMKMDEGLDSGPVLLALSTPISSSETTPTLHDRLATLGADLIVQTLKKMDEGSLLEHPQAKEKVTLAPKLTKEMGFLSMSEPAEVLDRKVRALTPWPGTSVEVEGLGKLKILEACPWPKLGGLAAGVLSEKTGMVLIGTVSGCLELKRMQWEGKSPIGPVEFLNGLKGRGQSLPLQLSSKSK